MLVAEGGGGDGDLAEWLAVAEGWSDDGFQREKKLYKMYRETEIGAQRWRDEEKKVSTTERERENILPTLSTVFGAHTLFRECGWVM